MIIDRDEGICFYHFLLLLIFIQHIQQPIWEYLWIIVARKIVALTVNN